MNGHDEPYKKYIHDINSSLYSISSGIELLRESLQKNPDDMLYIIELLEKGQNRLQKNWSDFKNVIVEESK